MAESEPMKCTSCGRRVAAARDWVEFACPACGKEKIIRCGSCKKIENTYKCRCGFEGP